MGESEQKALARRWLRGRQRAQDVERALLRREGLDPARSVALSLDLIEATWSVVQSEAARRNHERQVAPVRALWRRAAEALRARASRAAGRSRLR